MFLYGHDVWLKPSDAGEATDSIKQIIHHIKPSLASEGSCTWFCMGGSSFSVRGVEGPASGEIFDF